MIYASDQCSFSLNMKALPVSLNTAEHLNIDNSFVTKWRNTEHLHVIHKWTTTTNLGFKSVWDAQVFFILFLIEIHVPVCKEWKSWSYVAFLGVWSGPALFAYVHFYRTLCTSRPWTYYLAVMSRLSNVREILQFHYCIVTLYTEKEMVPQGQNRAVCFVTTAHLFYSYIYIYIYFFFFFF